MQASARAAFARGHPPHTAQSASSTRGASPRRDPPPSLRYVYASCLHHVPCAAQPLGKHAAMKGADGVFHWNLNRRPEVTPGGVQPPQTEYVGNVRVQYSNWYKSMAEQVRVRVHARACVGAPTQIHSCVSSVPSHPRVCIPRVPSPATEALCLYLLVRALASRDPSAAPSVHLRGGDANVRGALAVRWHGALAMLWRAVLMRGALPGHRASASPRRTRR